MDRCALFVDAGYVLADGAMAVHGTRSRESVSWDYEGLVQFLSDLATERSGLPLLRCYWYEGSAEGRRTADHDTLADLPGVKLRVTRTRPGREGVESEIHRDLAALAHNNAISDAMVVSAEEELAHVISDVQDLGMRVTLLHIAADGNWTISRTLRQECDDIVEVGAARLQPYVELISGAEPAGSGDDKEGGALIPLRPQANGARPPAYAASLAGSAPNGYQAPPAIYTAPVVAEYSRPAPQIARQAADDPVGYDKISYDQAPRYDDVSDDAPVEAPQQVPVPAPGGQDDPAQDLLAGLAAMPVTRQETPEAPLDQVQPAAQDTAPIADLPERGESAARPGLEAVRPAFTAHEMYGAPVPAALAPSSPAPLPAVRDDRSAEFPASRAQASDVSSYNPGALREPSPLEQGGFQLASSAASGSAQVRRLPVRGTGPAPYPAAGQLTQMSAGQAQAEPVGAGQPAGSAASFTPTYTPLANNSYSNPQPTAVGGLPAVPAGPAAVGPMPGNAVPAGPVPAGLAPGGQLPSGQLPGGQPMPFPVGPPGPIMPNGRDGGPAGPANPAGQQIPAGPPVPGNSGGMMTHGGVGGQNAPGYSPAPGQPGLSLADAVQAAHEEGQKFGGSVARDAPALWLEAVLARKPRMPSDLEARLLQGSSLPIDFLLHDEVRHALRRGFWDALERARR